MDFLTTDLIFLIRDNELFIWREIELESLPHSTYKNRFQAD